MSQNITKITKFMGPTWCPPGSCRPQMGPMLSPWTLLSWQWPYGVNRSLFSTGKHFQHTNLISRYGKKCNSMFMVFFTKNSNFKAVCKILSVKLLSIAILCFIFARKIYLPFLPDIKHKNLSWHCRHIQILFWCRDVLCHSVLTFRSLHTFFFIIDLAHTYKAFRFGIKIRKFVSIYKFLARPINSYHNYKSMILSNTFYENYNMSNILCNYKIVSLSSIHIT